MARLLRRLIGLSSSSRKPQDSMFRLYLQRYNGKRRIVTAPDRF